MSQPLTQTLGAFVAALRLEGIPREALQVVHTGFADCVGTLVAGSVEDPPRILQKALAPPPGLRQTLRHTARAQHLKGHQHHHLALEVGQGHGFVGIEPARDGEFGRGLWIEHIRSPAVDAAP